jgi:hypothetical protein
MVEPVTLSVIASTIAVATLAYQSTKSLFEFIDSLQDAPQLISDVKSDIKAVQDVLKSIELMLEGRKDSNVPGDLQSCLSSSRVPMQDCQSICAELDRKLKERFHNKAWDKVTVNFKEGKITKVRARLRDTRDVLNISLNVCSK